MQHGRRGLLPSSMVTIHDEEDVLRVRTGAQHQCWRQHFSKVLNIMIPFDKGEMELVRQWEEDDSLRTVPNCKTVEKALGMNNAELAEPNLAPSFGRTHDPDGQRYTGQDRTGVCVCVCVCVCVVLNTSPW